MLLSPWAWQPTGRRTRKLGLEWRAEKGKPGVVEGLEDIGWGNRLLVGISGVLVGAAWSARQSLMLALLVAVHGGEGTWKRTVMLGS